MIYNHPYYGFFHVWQIIAPMKMPRLVQNWKFRPVNCTQRHWRLMKYRAEYLSLLASGWQSDF